MNFSNRKNSSIPSRISAEVCILNFDSSAISGKIWINTSPNNAPVAKATIVFSALLRIFSCNDNVKIPMSDIVLTIATAIVEYNIGVMVYDSKLI